MKRSYGSYVNKRLSCPFCVSFFFSFMGFFEQWTLTYTYVYIFLAMNSVVSSNFSSFAVILKCSRRFINFIPHLMADPSYPFVPVLMTLVFKRKSLHTTNINIFSLSNTNTFSISLSSLCSLSHTFSFVYSDQPLHYDAGERPKFFPP